MICETKIQRVFPLENEGVSLLKFFKLNYWEDRTNRLDLLC